MNINCRFWTVKQQLAEYLVDSWGFYIYSQIVVNSRMKAKKKEAFLTRHAVSKHSLCYAFFSLDKSHVYLK